MTDKKHWYKANDGDPGSAFIIEPIFEKDIEVHTVDITESVGGDVAVIKLTANLNELDEDFKIDNEYTCKLRDKFGNLTPFKCYCYELRYANKSLEMNFFACDKKFIKGTFTTKYKSSDNAISSTWTRDRLDDPKVKTDLLDFKDPYYLYQMNESNNMFCNRVCLGYKHNTLFAYLLNGLKFNDLKNWKADLKVTDTNELELEKGSKWTNNKFNDEEVKFIDYSDGVDPYHLLVKSFDGIIPIDTEYKPLIENQMFNQRLMRMNQTHNFVTRNFPGWNVLDNIQIKSPQIEFGNCVITHRYIRFEKTKVETHYTIQAIK